MAKGRLKSCSETPVRKGGRECEFVQPIEYTQPKEGLDRVLGCAPPRWSTGSLFSMGEERTAARPVIAGEWFSIKDMRSRGGPVHVVRSSCAVDPLSSEMDSPFRLYYVNMCYRSKPCLHSEDSSLSGCVCTGKCPREGLVSQVAVHCCSGREQL